MLQQPSPLLLKALDPLRLPPAMLQQPPPLLLRALNCLLLPSAMLQQPPPLLLRALNSLLFPPATLHQPPRLLLRALGPLRSPPLLLYPQLPYLPRVLNCLLLHWSHCFSATTSSLSLALLQTNEGGWSAFSKTVKHYVAHMHSRGEHLLTPQSAPYKSGAMARAFAVTWKRSDRHTIAAAPSTRGPKVFSRPKKAKIVGRFSDTLKRARLETLTRFSIASMDTEVKASA